MISPLFSEDQKPSGGFIDLIFCHRERFYVVDWKSNHLGNSVGDYGRDRLERVMAEEYYFLQYHLYSLALHRYLRRMYPGYSYSKNFGGVFYLFIRGIGAESGSEYGLYHDLPPEELVTSLDRFIEGTK